MKLLVAVGRPATRVTLVPLSAIGSARVTVTASAAAGFGWFVSWISSVVIQWPATPAHVFVVP